MILFLTEVIHQWFIEYLEDLEDISIADKRIKALREGKEKIIPLEEVMKEYGFLE